MDRVNECLMRTVLTTRQLDVMCQVMYAIGITQPRRKQ
nr:MAG TPA: hypothetical protein [Caudoviricetes sp.]